MKVLRKAFNQPLDPVVSKFVSSVNDDAHLIAADITGSLAHVAMLEKVGLIGGEQAANITGALQVLKEQAFNGKFELDAEFEDVHMNVEKKLEAMIGDDAKLLHTARSRNDQVALDMRLYTLEQIGTIGWHLKILNAVLNEKAAENAGVVMPGYTHLQPAQPVSFAHVLNAFAEMLKRDEERFEDCKKRTACSPLGAGAIAGSGLPISPEFSAAALGFDKVFANSIDAVSDRDFLAEFVFDCTMTAVHLSQLAETLIIWCSKEFGFVNFSDAVTTTSSLMPQKKNPDPVEIVRAKAGTVVGDLMSLIVILKGLPVGYNRDLQETKPPAINAACTIVDSLKVMALAISEMSVNEEAMLAAASQPEMFATDIVEYLVNKGMPFRQAHETVAEVVSHARDSKTSLSKLPISEFKKYSQLFSEDVFKLFDAKLSVKSKVSPGGTGAVQIVSQSSTEKETDSASSKGVKSNA